MRLTLATLACNINNKIKKNVGPALTSNKCKQIRMTGQTNVNANVVNAKSKLKAKSKSKSKSKNQNQKEKQK